MTESHTFTIDEGQRQLIMLSLAIASIHRPGFDYALREISKLMNSNDIYQQFKDIERKKK